MSKIIIISGSCALITGRYLWRAVTTTPLARGQTLEPHPNSPNWIVMYDGEDADGHADYSAVCATDSAIPPPTPSWALRVEPQPHCDLASHIRGAGTGRYDGIILHVGSLLSAAWLLAPSCCAQELADAASGLYEVEAIKAAIASHIYEVEAIKAARLA